LGAKGNSTAGASALQIATNTTNLLLMQHRKCPSFTAMNDLFGQTPSCKPVDPKEVGAVESDADTIEDDGDDSQDIFETEPAADSAPAFAAPATTRPAPATVKPPAAATAPLAPASGKAAAPFHLAPSRNKVRHVHEALSMSTSNRKKNWTLEKLF
jgi:hypothetical protein